MDLNLRGRVAVVTGGASGIGRATAMAFAAEGANVAVWDLNGAREAAEAARARQDVRTLGIDVDVTDEAGVKAAAEETAREMGGIDHLVHSAAIGSGRFGFPFTNLG